MVKRSAPESLPEISKYHRVFKYYTLLICFHWLPPTQLTQFLCRSLPSLDFIFSIHKNKRDELDDLRLLYSSRIRLFQDTYLLFHSPFDLLGFFLFVCFIIFFMATPLACGSSQARDWIWAAAVSYTAAVAMPDTLTHCAKLGTAHTPLQQASSYSRILNPLCDSENSWALVLSQLVVLKINSNISKLGDYSLCKTYSLLYKIYI